jgi:predicted nucleic acid-binding protein
MFPSQRNYFWQTIAFVNNAAPLTRNAQDFSRVPGLRVEDWTI